MRGRVSLALLGGWLLLATSLVACGPEEPELPPAVSRPVTLRIAAFAGPETTALFRIIPEWEHITGNTVELGIFDPDTGERVVANDYVTYREAVISNAELGLGYYDVIIVDDPWMPYLAAGGLLSPLSPFGYETDLDLVERSASLGVWPPTFGPLPPDATGTPRGEETYALPLVGNVMMLWYRGDVIEGPETLDELRANLDNPDPAFVGSAGLAPSNNPHVFLTWLAARGGDVFDRSWRTTPLQSDLSAAALAEYIGETARLGIPFVEYEDERYTPHARMLDGTATAAVAWAADAQQILTSSVSDQLRVRRFPEGRRSSSLTGNWLLGIASDAQRPEAAYDFITWATSRDIMKTSALLGVPPARVSLFNDRQLLSRYPWLPDVQEGLDGAFARPRIPSWNIIEGILACAVSSGLQRAEVLRASQDGVDMDSALLEIAQEELAYHAALIEVQMEEWGFYRGTDYYLANPDALVSGDPRHEWACGDESR